MNTLAPTLIDKSPRSRQVIWAAIAASILLCTLILGFEFYEAKTLRENQITRTDFYARVLNNQVNATVDDSESILRALLPELQRSMDDLDAPIVSTRLSESISSRPFLRSLSIVNDQGLIQASSNPANIGQQVNLAPLMSSENVTRTYLAGVVSGRDLYELGQRPLKQALRVALPMVIPIDANPSTHWLVAIINPDYLATQFEQTLDNPALQAALTNLSGELIVATSGIALPSGTPLGHLNPFTKYLPTHEFASDVSLGMNAEQSFSAFRTTRDWPLVILVEQPYEVYLNSVMRRLSWAMVLLVSGCGLIFMGTWILRKSLLHDEQQSRDLLIAHQATKSSESRKLAILQSSPDAIVTTDAKGHIIEFNLAAERLFQRPMTTVLGQSMHKLLIPAPMRQAHQAGMARYANSGDKSPLNQRVEVEALRADGSVFPAELTIVSFHSNGTELFTATLRDITERKRVESALLESEARARATFEQAAVGVLQQTPDHRFLRVNEALCRLLGYSQPELFALEADSLIHPDERRACLRGMRSLFADKRNSFALQMRYKHKNGHYIWVLLTASVARNANNAPQYLIGIVQDISARYRAEQELAAARQRELEIGSRIQRSLLVTAPPPQINGLQVSSFSQASQGIDGDFVEIVRMGPHCVDVITGDIMGKGMAAAMMGAATKLQFSRSIAELVTGSPHHDTIPGPADIVTAVHRAMTPTLQKLEAFVTLSYTRIDLRRKVVTWVGCGHEETLLISTDNTPLVRLANQHPPLGILNDVQYQQEEHAMNPGSILFMCSDGVTDALRLDGERVGRDRVEQATMRQWQLHSTPAAALHTLRRDLLHSGVNVQDDVTMIIVQIDNIDSFVERIELPICLESIQHVRKFILQQTQTALACEVSCDMLALACVEAFTNVVRHTQGLLPGAPLELLVRHTAQALVVELISLGQAFLPPSENLDMDLSLYPEGGFGLSIIQGACDKVSYTHVDGVNTVQLTKLLAKQT